MPSLDTQYTQYGLDTSDGPPCASTSESLPCARVLLASGDITRAHKHQLESIDRSPDEAISSGYSRSRRPFSAMSAHPGALLLVGGGVLEAPHDWGCGSGGLFLVAEGA
jgi:hypothetical protein